MNETPPSERNTITEQFAAFNKGSVQVLELATIDAAASTYALVALITQGTKSIFGVFRVIWDPKSGLLPQFYFDSGHDGEYDAFRRFAALVPGAKVRRKPNLQQIAKPSKEGEAIKIGYMKHLDAPTPRRIDKLEPSTDPGGAGTDADDPDAA